MSISRLHWKIIKFAWILNNHTKKDKQGVAWKQMILFLTQNTSKVLRISCQQQMPTKYEPELGNVKIH